MMTRKEIGHHSAALKQRMKVADVVEVFNSVHSNRYDYSEMAYVNNKTKITIICKQHGGFSQTPSDHKRGANCPDCAKEQMANSKLKPIKDVIKDFKMVHGATYDYSDMEYCGAWKPVTIICDEHGTFRQSPEHHRRGSGCPACTGTGFNPLKPAILYYVKVATPEFPLYKIGITNRTIEERFGPDMPLVTIIKTWDYKVGADAYAAEQLILSTYKDSLYKGPPVLRCGNTELFTTDVGEYDE